MTDPHTLDPPSPFVAGWIRTLTPSIPEPRRALDLAMGRGRHAIALAANGYRVFGVDIAFDVVADALARAARQGLSISGWCADLTVSPLPRARFDAIVVARYLQRDLFPAIVDALSPGGVLIYETFTEAQRALGRGPTSPDHLLQAGELPRRTQALEPVFYEEVAEPDAVARLVARKRRNAS